MRECLLPCGERWFRCSCLLHIAAHFCVPASTQDSCTPAAPAGGPDRRGVGEGGGRPASVKASLSVAFGQRAPNRAGAREQGRGMGAELQGGEVQAERVGWWGGGSPEVQALLFLLRPLLLEVCASPGFVLAMLAMPAVGKSSGREERPRDRSRDEQREQRRDDYKRRSRSRSRERYDRDRRRDDRWGSSACCGC